MQQIINMVMRQLTRRFVNMGINKSVDIMNKKMKPKSNDDDQTPLR